jgi:hypothetical protein
MVVSCVSAMVFTCRCPCSRRMPYKRWHSCNGTRKCIRILTQFTTLGRGNRSDHVGGRARSSPAHVTLVEGLSTYWTNLTSI